MDQYRNGPLLWTKILSLFPEEIRVVVAGGAVRDYFLGLVPKDIDLFVAIENTNEFSNLIETLNKTGDLTLDIRGTQTIETYDAFIIGELVAVAEGVGFGYRIGIGARKSLFRGHTFLLETFDFDVLKACFCCRDGLIETASFSRDISARTATYSPTEPNDEARSRDRFRRFEARNPGKLTPKGFSTG